VRSNQRRLRRLQLAVPACPPRGPFLKSHQLYAGKDACQPKPRWQSRRGQSNGTVCSAPRSERGRVRWPAGGQETAGDS